MSVLRFSTAVVATTAFAFALNADPGILFIGTQGLGHVSPAAAWPFGMVQAGPDTSRFADRYVGDWPHTSGYQFDEEYLWRFSQCRFFGIGCGSMGFMGLLPSVIPFDADSAAYCKKMDKGSEMARPGYYSVRLAEDRIVCETSVLAHSAAYRFTFPNGSGAYLLVDPGWGVQGNEPVRRIDMTSPGACFGRYVMDSSLGFYPLDACGGEYVIGAPQVPQATLHLPNGKSFRIAAMNLTTANKYVKSVTLNGNAVRDWKIRHQDILKGGELVFEMADKMACCQDKERK